MALNLGPYNIIQLIAALSPLFISLFIFFTTMFNSQPINSIIYLCGLVIAAVCDIGVSKLISTMKPSFGEKLPGASLTCNVINGGLISNSSASVDTTILFYIIAYLLFPMILNNLINTYLLVFISMFTILNIIYQYTYKCSSILGLIIGAIIGIAVGTGWVFLLWVTDKQLLIFNSVSSNNTICSRPSKTKFLCKKVKKSSI